MIEFEKPEIKCLKVDEGKHYGKFVCEPLERGYGITIGNSLRRIMLSSLPGCAIKSIKIDGAGNEFTTIPNVVEDVPELILNLKMVRLKFDQNENKNLRIEFDGEGEVKAGDIITDGTVEILNPELHIANVAEGGKFGAEFDATADDYKYGSSSNDILCCGPYRVTDSTAKTKIEFTKNDAYWNANDLEVKKITWAYNDGKDVQKTYNDHKAGKLDACSLNTTTIPTAKADKNKSFDEYAYVSDTNATTFNAFINIKRQSYKNQDGKAKSPKNQKAADNASIALLNNDFRLALCHAIDRVTYNAQSVGEEVAAYSLRNTYTPGNFVTLPQAVTVKVGGEDKTFPAGTEYGAIVQAQLTADGSSIVAYKNGTTDGFDGWYNPTAAKAYLDKAVEALAKEDVVIDEKHPIQIDLPTFTGSEIYEARGNAIKKSIEASLGGFVKVNIIACKTSDDWYNAGYYTESGKEANYDIYDVSGWGPDYGDPSTYLDTMYADAKGAGYMVKCIGIY